MCRHTTVYLLYIHTHTHIHTYMHTHTYIHTQVYTYERGDGVGRAHDLVIQGFIRGVATAAVPVVACAGALYVLVGGRVQAFMMTLFGNEENIQR